MISLCAPFSDHAVLQQNKWNPVWGKASPGNRLKAVIAGTESFTKTTSAGTFRFFLPPLPAGGPYTLTITDLDSGENVSINDILAGEVWLASGQSNMEYTLGAKGICRANNESGTPLSEIQKQEFIDSLKTCDRFRILTVARNASGLLEEHISGEWKEVTPETAPSFSAIAAWFGKILREKLNVPVGIIVSSWGGSTVKAWTSRAGLLSNPETAFLANQTASELGKEDLWDERESSKQPVPIPQEFIDPGNKGVEWGWAEPEFDDSAWELFDIPGSWIQQKRAGNGAVWFRKEFLIPEQWAGKDLMLRMGPIDKQDVVYFNGKEIGRSGKDLDASFWNQPRNYPVPGNLVKAGKNIIAIRAYSFISDGALNGTPDLYFLSGPDPEKRVELAGNWKFTSELDLGITERPPQRLGPGNILTPSILYNAMIHPIKTYGIRGVIWYQGESNATTLADSLAYRKKLAAMIRDWRYQWEQGDFPFLQMQLANYDLGAKAAYKEDSLWAILRDQQRRICDDLPSVFMASAVGIGEMKDIHPQDKKSAGTRMALCALGQVYQQDLLPEGPRFTECIPEGNNLRVTFRFAEGLTLDREKEQSFYLAGADKIFYPAENIRIDGSSLILSSGKVASPRAVRYAWSGEPENTLFNGAGLPAAPFRSDDWDFSL
ncbi:MAG: hypothetical protein IJW05_05185 [Lentisphaeria bacterium]|nr:hypothetical protein [Lentisphaeria bacterium]